jgi:hypothetical protein
MPATSAGMTRVNTFARMSLKIADHLFYGPFPVDSVTVRANQAPVVFAIVCKGGEPWLPTFRLVDIDHSGDDGVVVAQHPRRRDWDAANDGELQAYLLDVPRKQGDAQHRRMLAEAIRAALAPSGEIPLSGGM